MSEDNLEVVSQEMMDELEHLAILRGLGDDFLDTATRIKENENDEYDNIIEFTRSRLGSEEEMQSKVLNYVHFGTPKFEAEKWTNPQTEVVEVEE